MLSGAGLAAFALLAAGFLRIDRPVSARSELRPDSLEEARRFAENRSVEPGKVHWHASFDAARAASKVSGKPVLLFHMMGRLDRQFC